MLGELSRASSLLRDILNDSFTKIHVNDMALFDEMKEYISGISPGQEKILTHYNGKLNIFENFGIHYGYFKNITCIFSEDSRNNYTFCRKFGHLFGKNTR